MSFGTDGGSDHTWIVDGELTLFVVMDKVSTPMVDSIVSRTAWGGRGRGMASVTFDDGGGDGGETVVVVWVGDGWDADAPEFLDDTSLVATASSSFEAGPYPPVEYPNNGSSSIDLRTKK
jgi:hypothetical protein